MKTAYYLKILTGDRRGPIASRKFNNPNDFQYPIGEWTPHIYHLIPCYEGYHVMRLQDLPTWNDYLGNLWLVEAKEDGKIESGSKIVVHSLRLIRRLRTYHPSLRYNIREVGYMGYWNPQPLRPWNRDVASAWCKLWGIKLI